VLSVSHRGSIRLVTTFPTTRQTDAPPFLGLPPGTQIPYQEVPTSVATKGHDGAYYVSQLTGFPFPPGQANIHRVDPRTGNTTIYASGLTNVTDLAFKGRTLYAVQISAEGLLNGPIGSLVKITPRGSTHTTIKGGLSAPYGIAVKGDYAYVTVGSVAKDQGQVLKIRL
ncbi:MAG TPA: ScyD/ScyE family protein, partial [Microlunatus sp.]|nr:ScyD/ScyE family protein [Microlunatus sp.]